VAGLAPPVPYWWQVGDTGNAALLNAQLFTGLTYLLNPPLAWLYQTASQSVASSSTWTPILLDTSGIDTYGGHSTTSNTSRYVCQQAGIYQCGGSITWAANATGYRAARIAHNGSAVQGSEVYLPGGSVSGQTTVVVTVPVALAVGDYIEIHGWQSSGGALSTIANAEVAASLNIEAIHL
jgi:hypothetical protein